MLDEQATQESAAIRQLRWIERSAGRKALPDSEVRDYLEPALLETIGGPDAFNAALAGIGPLALRDIRPSGPDRAQASVRVGTVDHLLTVRADAAGRVDWFSLDEAPLTSWTQIDTRLAELGPRVAFAAEIDRGGHCHLVHGVDADTQRPIGSAFKLYVLGALGRAVADGRASWNERLAVRDEWKSLPSGTVQNHPDGTRIGLAELADKMMSISDNTATDHLIHRLGRDTVQDQMALFGHQRPAANIPLLTTKAFFQLKCLPDDDLAVRYPTLPHDERVSALEELERQALPQIEKAWPEPKYIDQIEWFATPADICRAYAGLLLLDQPEIGHALSLNDDGLHLDSARFPVVWYKGGSEPGVVTMHYLVRTPDDRALVTSLMASDPTTALDAPTVAAQSLPIVRGAFHLLATA
ncbi:serine hydrolase [Nocardia terpenica]|uniref:serine hydrolase n=1 Tax=Nocardia terpenica TaxID=455432 RepID=UPI00142E18FE|nr:serine hydrolase [Nocardia terpenica]